MKYYRHSIGDYDSATLHLSLMEHGAYLRLIHLYYRLEQAIPGDLDRVCKLISARSRREKEAVTRVLGEFFEMHDGLYVNERCEAEICRVEDLSRVNTENASLGGKALKHKKLKVPNGTKSQSESVPNECLSNNQYPILKEKDLPLTPSRGNVFVLPDRVDGQAWADFDRHRTTLNRKTWTPQAKKKTADLLAKYPASTQREMVDASIRNGWRGIFAPKGPAPDDDRPEWMRGIINMPRSGA